VTKEQFIMQNHAYITMGPGNVAVGKSRVIMFSNHLFTHFQLHYVPPENVISDNKVNG